MLGWILIAIGGGLVLVLLLWKKIKPYLPWTTPAVIDTAASVATQAAAEAALESLVLLSWANNDLDAIAQLGAIKAKIKAWQTAATAATQSPTVESLQAELASLKAKLGG